MIEYDAPFDMPGLHSLFPMNSLWHPGCFFGPLAGQMTRSRLKQLWVKEFFQGPIRRTSYYQDPFNMDPTVTFQVFPFWWLLKVMNLPQIQESLQSKEYLGRWEFKNTVVWRSVEYALGKLSEITDVGDYWRLENVHSTYKKLGLRRKAVR